MDCITGYVQGLSGSQWAEENFPATEMISGDGELKEKELEDFMKLHECGVSYAVVAIMGPQSSGKSTLLNNLFNTNFSEMDASIGRNQTTSGVWIAKAPNLHHPSIMVMDVEGTDGQERGQDGTTFEKRSTLLSLVLADIFIINTWCNDIGRENAANWPLLKTIFAVMMQTFTTRSRKTTLHFVIRDTSRMSPIKMLQTKLKTDVHKIWETVPKTDDFKGTPLSECFNVVVDALPHYEYATGEFCEEVIQLRKRILNSIRVAGDREVVIPISAFSLHVKTLWETIKENKELDLPTHKEMVATVRCEEIAKEKLKLFQSDKEWLKVEAAAKVKLVPDFGAKIKSIWSRYFSEYDSESKYFEEGVRNEKRKSLESDAFDVVYPAYIKTLGYLRVEVLNKFKKRLEKVLSGGGGYAESVATCRQSCEDEFDERSLEAAILEQSVWDATFHVRKELVRDIENHALLVQTQKLPQVIDKCQARLATKIRKYLNKLFKLRDEEGFSWDCIRSFVKHETDSAASTLRSDIAAFDLDDATVEQKVHDLQQYGRKLVEKTFKLEKKSVIRHMKGRYILSLARKEEPLHQCLKVLSTMAAIRLDKSSRDDEVEKLLFSALIEERDDIPLASYTWIEVPTEMTLITPAECKDTWELFQQDIQTRHQQIKIADQMPGNSETPQSKSDTSKLPFWVRLGTWLLGVADLVKLLWKRRDLMSAIPLIKKLAGEGAELIKDGEDMLNKLVNNGSENVWNWQIMKKLEAVLTSFYDFMKRIFTKKSAVDASSNV